MLRALFGPKYTLKDAMIILEEGLRSGEITLDSEPEADRVPEAKDNNLQTSTGKASQPAQSPLDRE